VNLKVDHRANHPVMIRLEYSVSLINATLFDRNFEANG
jgi:hypothetical protein